MTFVSQRFVWIPLYALFVYMALRTRPKHVPLLLIIVTLLIICSDQLSVVIKQSVQRLRPCHNESLQHLIHLPDGCGGQFGFVSSHAANTFGLAIFLGMFFHFKYKWLKWFMLIWASLICYSRIYLGVHYPADIGGGAILGITLAFIFYFIYDKLRLKLIHD
jgi:undecaprenyl-diphosphatase